MGIRIQGAFEQALFSLAPADFGPFGASNVDFRPVFSGFLGPRARNIFVMKGGKVALIDCGQVAQIFREQRLLVAEVGDAIGA